MQYLIKRILIVTKPKKRNGDLSPPPPQKKEKQIKRAICVELLQPEV